MYTTDQLRTDLDSINPKLNAVCPGAMFTIQGRVGYLGLAVLNKGRFDNTIIEGSAAECLSAANKYIVDHTQVIVIDYLSIEERVIQGAQTGRRSTKSDLRLIHSCGTWELSGHLPNGAVVLGTGDTPESAVEAFNAACDDLMAGI